MNFKKIVLIFVVAVLMILASACKKADIDPIEPDDVEFVSVNPVVTERYDDFAKVFPTYTFRVRASTPTRLKGEMYLGKYEGRLIAVDVPNTNGQWVNVTTLGTIYLLDFGTYEVSGYVILLSTGKKLVIPTTSFTIE